MPSRAVVWTLAILAVVLVVIPLLGMVGMMMCCGTTMMGMGGNMAGMSMIGAIWMLFAAGVIVVLVVVLVRALGRT